MNKMLYVTGPNNGGKSTYVKTVGLVHLLSQNGLPITAQSAEVSFVDGIYTHFVAPDDITQGDGRYRNELKKDERNHCKSNSIQHCDFG